RQLREGLNVLCDWCERGLRVVSTSQAIDFSGITGRLIAAVILAIAEMENETRRERQAVGIAIAKKAGVYKGRKVGSYKAKPERAYVLRAKGNSYKEIARALGVTPMTVWNYLQAYKVTFGKPSGDNP